MTKKEKEALKELQEILRRADELISILSTEEEGYTMEQAAQITAAAEPTKVETDAELEKVVTESLRKLGIPAHVKGYQYARTGLIMAVKNTSVLESITKVFYPQIALKYHTTPSRVERAIRHAIEVAWTRGDTAFVEECFGYTISAQKGKPTNSEFIAVLTDKIRLQMH